MYANFLLGTLGVSPAARLVLKRLPLDLIARHAVNDHGRITLKEKRVNESSMVTCGEITSRFAVDPTDRKAGFVVVITNASWNETTVYLESE